MGYSNGHFRLQSWPQLRTHEASEPHALLQSMHLRAQSCMHGLSGNRQARSSVSARLLTLNMEAQPSGVMPLGSPASRFRKEANSGVAE